MHGGRPARLINYAFEIATQGIHYTVGCLRVKHTPPWCYHGEQCDKPNHVSFYKINSGQIYVHIAEPKEFTFAHVY